MNPSPSTTMDDIAQAAGVHQTTVSRALRNDQRLPVSTRQRIQRLAESMNYRPHPLVSALVALRRSRHPPDYQANIAVVLRGSSVQSAHRVLRRDYVEGITAAAERRGYKVETLVLGKGGLTNDRLNQVLISRNICGVIIAPLPEAHGHFNLSWERFSTIAIEYTFREPAFDRVLHDSYGGMRRIMAECRRRGVRHVGLTLTTGGDERTDLLNGAAYWVEQRRDGFFFAVPPLVRDDWDEATFGSWYSRFGLEAVVTSNDFLPQIQAWADRRGLTLGQDLQLINVNSRSDGVAGICQNSHAIGVTAGQMVIEKIIRNDRGIPESAHTVQIPGNWREGKTLKPVPSTGSHAGKTSIGRRSRVPRISSLPAGRRKRKASP